MRKDFAVFVLTHGRANTMKTVKTLKKTGYKGALYLVIDNEDSQIDEYKKNYSGIAEIIVFDKQKEMARADIDPMDNFKKPNSALYARNFILDYARENKIEYVFMLDDDISNILFRYADGEKLRQKAVKNINAVIDSFIDFMKCNKNIVGSAFCNAGGLIGGLKGKFSQEVGKTLNQAMFFKTSADIHFMGTAGEDFNICAAYSKVGMIFLELYSICGHSPSRGEGAGGLEYGGWYVANFYPVMIAPYCCTLNEDCKLNWRRRHFAPEIISERWKK